MGSGKLTKAALEQLSNDAKAVAVAFFPNRFSSVKFNMQVSRPGARCQAGIDELVEAGLVRRTNLRQGGFQLVPLADFSECRKWQMQRLLSGELEADSFNLWEPIAALPEDDSHG